MRNQLMASFIRLWSFANEIIHNQMIYICLEITSSAGRSVLMLLYYFILLTSPHGYISPNYVDNPEYSSNL